MVLDHGMDLWIATSELALYKSIITL